MQPSIRGTFHFHSTYSHDGRSTLPQIVEGLKRQGFGFCIMTEHFEDFDAPKLRSYVEEARALTAASGFVLVPGIEVNLKGIDTILFPVNDFTTVEHFMMNRGSSSVFSVLAHPSKYAFENVAQHLEQYEISGIELWNQQADSSYRPPLDFLRSFKALKRGNDWRYLFGCDLHDVSLRASNVISLAASAALDVDSIVGELRAGRFSTRNLPTGLDCDNRMNAGQVEQWLDKVLRESRSLGGIRWQVRQVLKRGFKLLPRTTQRGLNDFKNFVRNRA